MSDDSESFIDVLEDYFNFHKTCARGVDGGFFRYVYNDVEPTEECIAEYAALSERFVKAIKQAIAPSSDDEDAT